MSKKFDAGHVGVRTQSPVVAVPDRRGTPQNREVREELVASFGDFEEKKFKDCAYLNVRARGLSVLVTVFLFFLTLSHVDFDDSNFVLTNHCV